MALVSGTETRRRVGLEEADISGAQPSLVTLGRRKSGREELVAEPVMSATGEY